MLGVCCEILLLLNIADMDCLSCGKLWSESSAECHVHLVGVNRLSACKRFFLGCIVGKMAQDVGMVHVNVLWCHSHLVWLVFEGSIPTCACFPLENFFVTCSCCFFFLELFLEMVREKRGGKGKMHTL